MNEKNRNIQILECTLRDGSYAIDYQFTAEDTAIIAAGLEQAGFSLIEIGHGLGLNASSPAIGVAASTDEEYLAAAAGALKKAKFGMFFIPGIARMEDIDLAAKHGMGFVRIGTNVNEVEQAESYIKHAKDLGMMVFSNLMKSYALPIDDVVKKAATVAKYGAEVVVIVDSAGGMMPNEVFNYVARIKKEVDIKVGFHGHNNLLLAVANSIEAVKAGAEIVDSSLQGMGRSAGNAQTEVLAVIMERLGYSTGIDVYKTMDMGEKIVKPIMGGGKGIDAISAILGYAQFHSSYLKIVNNMAQKYNVDPRQLVIKVSEVDRLKVTEELAEKIAQEIKKQDQGTRTQGPVWNMNLDFKGIIKKHAPEEIEKIAQGLAQEMHSLARKFSKQTIFTIAGSHNKNKKEASFPFIRQNAVYIIGNAEVASTEQARCIARAIDNQVDYILVDVDHWTDSLSEMFSQVRNVTKHTRVLPYRDSDAQVNATDALVGQFLENSQDRNIVILGDNSMAIKLAGKLSDRSKIGKVTCLANSAKINSSIDMLIGMAPFQPLIDAGLIKQLAQGGVVIDAGPGSIAPAAIAEAHQRKIPIYRVDMRAGLSGEIVNVLETEELKNKIMGNKEIAGIQVVAGGVLGKNGEIVVDSITKPTRIIGVADGQGGLLGDKDARCFEEKIKKVKIAIAKAMFCD